MSALGPTLLKLAVPLVVSAFVLWMARRRGWSWRDDLALRWPAPKTLALWIGLWAAWVALGEFAIGALGMGAPTPWPALPPLIIALRIAAIGLAGPIAEELVVRGLVYFRLRATRLGVVGAIIVCAAGWAAMHVQYEWRTIAMIFADGLFLGAAREKSRSTFVPIVLHVLANLYSIGQSLGLVG